MFSVVFFFQQAYREGLVDIVRTVLHGGAPTIDTLDEEGFAPIHHAVRYDRAEIVQLLINAGSGKKGRTNRPAGFPSDTNTAAVVFEADLLLINALPG